MTALVARASHCAGSSGWGEPALGVMASVAQASHHGGSSGWGAPALGVTVSAAVVPGL